MYDTKKMFCVALLSALPALAATADCTRTETLVSYDRPKACAGATFMSWNGKKEGSARWNSPGLRLEYFDSAGSFSLGDELGRAVRKSAASAKGTLRHVRFAVSAESFTAPLRLRCVTSAGTYDNAIGVDPSGMKSTVLVRPGGFSKSRKKFEWRDVSELRLYAPGGSGTYTLHEIAFVFDETPAPPARPEVAIDEFVLFPEPRVFRLGTAQWPLSEYSPPVASGEGALEAAGWFRRRAGRFWGSCGGGARPFTMRIDAAAEGVGDGGYAISVRKDGIDVVARDGHGLACGARALMETIHLASGDAGEPVVREMTVADSPRISNRVFHARIPAGGQKEFAALLERFALPAGFNLVSFDPGPFFKYDCDPGSGFEKGSWTPAEFADLVDSMNAAGVAAMPFFMSPGHQWGNLLHGSRNMELSENGDCESLCVRHPRVYGKLFAHMAEVAGICSRNPRHRAEFFYTGGDEVRWRDRDGDGNECRRCGGIPRNGLLLEHVRKVEGWCRETGWRMLMCSDMYSAQHNGFNKFLGARVADSLPRSIGLVHWSAADWDELPAWRRRGFGNWRVMTGYDDDPVSQDGLDGQGIALYNDRWWLSHSRNGAGGMYSPLAIAFAGADGWGEPPRSPGTLERRAETWGNHLMRRWSRKPLRMAGGDFGTIDIGGAANASASPDFDFSRKSIGGVPCAFAKSGAGISILAADGREHAVKLGRRAASLVFLHTARLDEKNEDDFRRVSRKEDWMFGMPVASWRVEYADGTCERIAVRYGWNVGEFDTRAEGRSRTYGRFIGDARYAWSGRDGTVAYSHEWANPHPEKTISAITLERKPGMIGYELWALSARRIAIPRAHKPGSARLGGFAGRRQEELFDERVRGPEAKGAIYEEAVNAFRTHFDDARPQQSGPGRKGLWQGEYWGKHMLSAAAVAENENDAELKAWLRDKALAFVKEFQRRDGYLCSYADPYFVGGLDSGRDGQRTFCWNLWGRKYTLWALVEIARIAEEPELLEAAKRLMDQWILQLDEKGVRIEDTGCFAGMPSMSVLKPLLLLFEATGEKRYMDYADSIVSVWDGDGAPPPNMIRNAFCERLVDGWYASTWWGKAYEMMSCMEGLAAYARIGNRPRAFEAVERIVAKLDEGELNVLGSVGLLDHFSGAAKCPNAITEPCDVVHWIRVNRDLFLATGKAHYLDSIEFAFYNAFLAGLCRGGKWGALGVRSHGSRHFILNEQIGMKRHQCCIDNMPRTFVDFASTVLSQTPDGALSVNLYSDCEGECGDCRVSISGGYPFDDAVSVKVAAVREGRVRFRIPSWAESAHLDGEAVSGEWCEARLAPGDNVFRLAFGRRPRIIRRGSGKADPCRNLFELEKTNPEMAGMARDTHAACVAYGPVLLAKARVAGCSRDETFAVRTDDARRSFSCALEPISAEDCERAWMATLKGGGEAFQVNVCDFASASPDDNPENYFSIWF